MVELIQNCCKISCRKVVMEILSFTFYLKHQILFKRLCFIQIHVEIVDNNRKNYQSQNKNVDILIKLYLNAKLYVIIMYALESILVIQ